MAPPDLSKYILSEEESLRIFREIILPAELPPEPAPTANPTTATARQPLAVLLAGQTGAGKSHTSPLLLSRLTTLRGGTPTTPSSSSPPPPPPIHLIADVYKAYHPAYASLLPDSALASRATGPDARRWLRLAGQEAIRRRADVLLESACRHPGDFAALAAAFGKGEDGGGGGGGGGGYRVEVVFMAVPAGLSRLGILTRFFEGKMEGTGRLGVRLTPRRTHDESFEAVLEAGRWVDDGGGGGEGLVDQVVVLRRGNMVAFGAERERNVEGREGDGTGVRGGFGGRVVEAVERERRRRLTNDEKDAAIADLQRLEGVEDAREVLAEVKGLLEPLMDGGKDGDEFPELRPLLFPGDGGNGGNNVLKLGIA